MEKLKFIIPILLLFTVNSCIIDRSPDYTNACFTISGSDHYVNDPVNFINCSQYATSYEWSFGDGFTSNREHPDHTYLVEGSYQVSMTAYGAYNHETFTDVVTVGGSTDLDILIMYLGTEDPVSNCEVTLYGTEIDWENLENPIFSITTGTNGIAFFEGLSPVTYFIDAYKYVSENSFYSNYYQGYATLPLNENEVNLYNIFVELLYNSKDFKRKSFVIKHIEKSTQEEHDRIIRSAKNK